MGGGVNSCYVDSWVIADLANTITFPTIFSLHMQKNFTSLMVTISCFFCCGFASLGEGGHIPIHVKGGMENQELKHGWMGGG